MTNIKLGNTHRIQKLTLPHTPKNIYCFTSPGCTGCYEQGMANLLLSTLTLSITIWTDILEFDDTSPFAGEISTYIYMCVC